MISYSLWISHQLYGQCLVVSIFRFTDRQNRYWLLPGRDDPWQRTSVSALDTVTYLDLIPEWQQARVAQLLLLEDTDE